MIMCLGNERDLGSLLAQFPLNHTSILVLSIHITAELRP